MYLQKKNGYILYENRYLLVLGLSHVLISKENIKTRGYKN